MLLGRSIEQRPEHAQQHAGKDGRELRAQAVAQRLQGELERGARVVFDGPLERQAERPHAVAAGGLGLAAAGAEPPACARREPHELVAGMLEQLERTALAGQLVQGACRDDVTQRARQP